MSKRNTTDTCCLTLPLKLEKWQEDRLSKRFEIARQIYNTLVHAELKKLRQVEQSAEYRQIQVQLREMYQNNTTKTKEFRDIANRRRKLLDAAGFREYDFKSAIKDYYKYFKENIGSNVAIHGIAPLVWTAFENKLYKNGKKVHYKRPGDIYSLRGYSVTGKSGGSEIMFRGTYVEWKGLKLPIKRLPNNDYETAMLEYRVKYVRILRKPGKHKNYWYAQLSLEGKPVIKMNPVSNEPVHPIGSGAVGIDIGPQTIAYASQSEAGLLELASQVQNIERQKGLLQRKMERSRRDMNPENYMPDGTFRRGVKLTKNKSKHYCKLQRELAYLQHRQAETRKRQHIELANHLLSLGDCFYVEDMKWLSLTHRAKETEISEKTGRIKRKKRFGKSIANKAPATLIGILDTKCKSLGIPGVVKVPTIIKASQYNHQSDTYEKKPLGQRWNDMPSGERIQRDLYSAFLLQHLEPDLTGYNKKMLAQDYPQFVEYHNHVINDLSMKPKTLASMGIRRKVS